MSRLPALLDESGPIAACIEGFQARAEQQAMAEAVERAIADREVLLAEAGTGTGKTFAYLVPALLSGRKVVVSTGTKTLQDQLFSKDLPLLRRALGAPARVALLKGRGNYLCRHRFESALVDGRFDSREQAARFQAVRQWATVTRSGDLSELPQAGTDEGLRSRISSTADNCLGQECPRYSECFLMEARRQAQEADLVVVNHHLLLADWALKDRGYGEVLPDADVYILDEAHQLPEVAAQFFGLTLSSRQLLELVRDAQIEYRREAGDAPAVPEALERLSRAVIELRLTLGSAGQRSAWAEVASRQTVTTAVDSLGARLGDVADCLAPLAQRGKGLEQCLRRVESLVSQLAEFLEPDADSAVAWFETYTQSFMLRLTPIDVATPFSRQLARQPAAWILTSATLSVGDSFEHFAVSLGLEQPSTLRLNSPFDYARNALLYVPPGLPAPTAPDYLDGFLEHAEQVIRTAGGRAFILFTSHRALREAAQRLAHLPYPLLVQGEAGQGELLQRFREAGDAVLLGSASFWEGVDVRGEALSLVVIDRLPFASPGDPVVQARISAMRAAQGNPFMEYQVPLAVISLRQGVGRLIRDVADRGVLMIGDNRLVTRSYGRIFRASLPPMPVTRDPEDVRRFFAEAALQSAHPAEEAL